MWRLLTLKFGRLYRCLKFLFVVSLLVFMLMNTHSLFASFQKNELADRRFISLNKCPACFGTSWCRKFMNGQITFETWGRLRILDFLNVKNVYFAQYGEPREGARRVVLKRLGSNQELIEMDQKVCKRATGRPRCDVTQAIYKTQFSRLNGEVRLLTPDVVEGWSDLVHCPSQRLLDRIVRRYAETKDSGSFLMKNLKDSERMQLLLTLAFNPEPLVLQASPSARMDFILQQHVEGGFHYLVADALPSQMKTKWNHYGPSIMITILWWHLLLHFSNISDPPSKALSDKASVLAVVCFQTAVKLLQSLRKDLHFSCQKLFGIISM